VPFSFLVVFVLLIMALGTVRSALAVLIVAPFAMSGGVFGLLAAHIPLSVSAAVGFIALLGQVCLASLLVVSAVDRRRDQGADLIHAVAGGTASRFRTVLMTALLAMLGLMPAAVSSGVGSETQRPFAVVIVSGLITAVAVTLFVLPFVYSLVSGQPRQTAVDPDDGGEVIAQ
jgi:cobalt-zinc-cadmium resistance protein CzcA